MAYALYDALLLFLLVLTLPYWLWKQRGTGRYTGTFRARLGHVPAEAVPATGGAIWVHAVSVGEALAARDLVAALRARFPDRPLVVSTTTPTGQAVAREKLRGVDGFFYAPFDVGFAVRRVLAEVRPSLLVLVETEIWPGLVHAAAARGVKIAIVNGRISPRSFPRYRAVRALLRPVLAEMDAFLMQAEPHAERIRALGAAAERVRVSGNLKYDVEPHVPSAELRAALDTQGAPLWLAGSTAAGEEEAVLDAFATLRREVADLRLVIAPRRTERFDVVAALVASRGLRVVRRSEGRGWAGAEVMILDTLGELSSAYALCTVAFVGGSLVPHGGQNPLEPAIAGRAVVVGPHMENFQEITDAFLAADALVQVADGSGLAAAVGALLRDEARRTTVGENARKLMAANRGAVARTVDALADL